METETSNYTFSFESSQTPENIFETLIDVHKWWVELFGEDIKGSSNTLNDEFTFSAGNGLHYTKQQLIELVPNQKIVWQVTESNLSFAAKTDEWTNTKFGFEISKLGKKSKVTFTHYGLVPKFECYNDCAGAWTQYLENLAEKLK
nr:SRPBCC domain-containing protein [uncultured Flavobacterium sp.]